MTPALKAAIAAIDHRFQSGNSVPIDKAAVPAAEWAALRAAADALAAQPAGEPVAQTVTSKITIDFRQATELLELFGGEPTDITLMTGNGHAGPGLYAVYNADPDGAVYLGQADEEAVPVAAQPARAGGDAPDWRELAARVMDALAENQEHINAECPEHVKCYPSWEHQARWLRWLAEMFRTGKPVGGGAGVAAVHAALAAAPAPVRAGGDALATDDDVKAARSILALLCENGHVRMSIPVRHNDEDMVLSRIIERAALAAAPQPAASASTVESVLHAFESKERGIPQAHIAAQLVSELRFALEAAAPAQAPQPAAAEPAGGVADELAKHLRAAHAFIENTDAFGRTASRGILDCGGCIWNVDESKAALSRHETGARATQVEQPAASTVPATGRLVTFQLVALKDGGLTSDIQTHDNSFEDVARGLAVCKQEIDRVFKERKSCPYFPASKREAQTPILRNAAPAAVERDAQDARDAARYRWLRTEAGGDAAVVSGQLLVGGKLDALADSLGIGSSKEGGDA